MRSITKILLYNLILGILHISCTSEKKDHPHISSITKINRNDSIITIDLDKDRLNGFCHTSQLFKKATPILLETHNNALISKVDKVFTLDESILVLDSKKAKGLFLFDKGGKFIKKIGQVGQGPDEYLSPSDFTVDKASNLVYILDEALHKINVYNLPTGDFKTSIKIQGDAVKSFHIEYSNGKLYADAFGYHDHKFLIREIDLNTGEQKNCWLDNTIYNKGYDYIEASGNINMHGSPFYSSSCSDVKIVQLFMDTILSIDNRGITPYLSIRSNHLTTHQDVQMARNDNNGIILGTLRLNKTFSINNFLDGADFVYFAYIDKGAYRVAIHDKKTKLDHVYSVCIDDIVFKVNINENKVGILPEFIFSDATGAYCCLYGDNMQLLLNAVQNDELNLSQEDIDKLEALDEDSNPVLFYYEYK